MAYIGKSIESGTFSVLDTSGNTYNGSNTTFNLGTQVGSVAQLLVSHDGVIQKPGTDYTLASGGTQITFTTAPASGASIFIVEISGAVGGPLDADLNGTELILDADGDTSLHASTDDQIDVKIAGADDFKFSANAMNVLSGSTLTIDSGATITNSGTASGFGVALDDVTTGDAASTLATSAGNITIDAQGDDTDIIFKGTDGGADTTFLTIDGSAAGASAFNSYITSTAIYGKGDGNTGIQFEGSDVITIHTGGNERMRITSSGNVGVGTTNPGGSLANGAGVQLLAEGYIQANVTNGQAANFARSNDGQLIQFSTGTTGQGNISISGGTVSYNSFAGSHWSRLADNSKPTILRGTVMESISTLMDWYQVEYTKDSKTLTEYIGALPSGKSVGDSHTVTIDGVDYTGTISKEENERLPMCKISNTEDSKAVYGVFMDWDVHDDKINDMYVTSLGAFVVRIHKDETVAIGDYLQSKSDGTAKKQADDILRASTIAKVTSTEKTHEYADGSYCVPCTLHCG